MGKRIISQRRGRGSFTYKSPSHRFKGSVNYPKRTVSEGVVVDIFHDPGRTAPLAKIKFDNNEFVLLPAAESLRVNDTVSTKSLKLGSILKLSEIPAGTDVFAIERYPGNGPVFCRSSGTFAKIISKTQDTATLLFPSKKELTLNKECRASIGIIAGSGRKDKPFVKAGKRFHAMRARNKLYPLTSGVAMNAVDHPFGSGRGRHVGKPKTVSRNAPSGRKVGLIAARRTGKKK